MKKTKEAKKMVGMKAYFLIVNLILASVAFSWTVNEKTNNKKLNYWRYIK